VAVFKSVLHWLGGCPCLALTACLLCAEPSLPRPSISLSPTGVTAPGADVTIRCQGQRRDVRFFLHKAGDSNPQRHMDPAGAGAEFRIPTMGRQHGGSYSCSYQPQSESFVFSEPSDPVELVVAGEGPGSTWLPNLGGLGVGLVCLFLTGVVLCLVTLLLIAYFKLLLRKLWAPRSPEVPTCPLIYNPSVCYPWRCPWGWVLRAGYRHRGGVCVSPSHSCLCVNAELPAPRPSISVSPSGVIAVGGAVTIRCQCRCEARRLFLYKDKIQIRELDAAGDGGEFTIPSARWADGGVYMCQSRSRSEPPNWSDPSDIVRIIVAGEGPGSAFPLPAPHPARPSWGSLAVTIQCWGQHQNMRFLMYKDGNPNVLQDAEPAGNLAEFPIRSVNRRDAGSYSCYYHKKWYPFTWSHPSDSMELVVAGELPGSVSALPAAHPAGHSGAGACARGASRCRAPESVGLEHRTPPGSRASSSGCGGHTKCPSKSGHIFLPVHAPDQGGLCTNGTLRARLCPEPWAQQRGRQLGDRDRITGGFPSKRQQQLLLFRGRGRGDPCPRGSCRAGAFPRGMLPRPSPLWGRTEESGPRGCPAGPAPIL
uniref:Ig-like domain-containing protein n=1 Tax=Terrapene triunguis TaxID=2587831 RepID=A0A674K4B9_9SAUR